MTAALIVGTVFAGRYRIVRCLATGGMGTVYEAVHLETERRRALKVMHPHLFESDELCERFKREARIAAHVESEHIVDVSDAGVDDDTGMPFLVMELLRGEELGARIKRAGPLPPAEVLTYLGQAAQALDRTHASAIVHRDLKPENLFLTTREDGGPRIKILDFGVAKLLAEGGAATGTTRSMGTPLYMAPEQFRSGARLTPAADVYAVGMMAYTLLVGEPYWAPDARSAGDVIAFALVAMGGPVEPATRRAAARGVSLPPDFDVWFAHVTAVDPAARFRSATEAVRALGDALDSTPRPGGGLPESLRPRGSRVTPAPATVAEHAATSTDAAVASAPVEGSRGSVVAIAVLLALAALAAGAWLAPSRSGGPDPAPGARKGPAEMRAPAAAPTAAPAPAATESPTTAASPTVPATPAVSPTAPAVSSAAPASRPQAPGPATTTGGAARRPVIKAPHAKGPARSVVPLIGRD